MIPGGGSTGAMLWKEVRENLKWAVLALAGTSATLFLMLQDILGRYVGSPRRESPLNDDELLIGTAVGGAAAALLLGLAQTLPERRPDQWAFLVHRPVSRTRLFLVKALAGLGLYALAVGIPFACAVAWVATPGRMSGPFDPAMALPGVADLLGGVMYYFAGMVVGLREARWYGSRVLAVGPAVIASFVVMFVPEFWHALLAILVSAAILATAAWGLFRTGGTYAPQPLVARASLATAVFAGILLIGVFAVGAAATLLPPERWTLAHTRYVIDPAGKIVRLRQDGVRSTITDPHGNPLPEYADVTDEAVQAMYTGQADAALELDRWQWERARSILQSYRRPHRFFLGLHSTEAEHWYYVRNKGYIIGYGPDNGSVIGYLTPAGFHDGPDAPADRFSGELPLWAFSAQSMLAFTSAVYNPDFPARRLDRVFVPPAGEQVVAATTALGERPAPAGTRGGVPQQVPVFFAFATGSTLHVHALDGRQMFSMPLEHGPAQGYPQVIVTWRQTLDRYYVWYQPRWMTPEMSTLAQHVVELTPAGEVVARHALPPLPPIPPPPERLGEAVLVGAASPSLGLAASLVVLPWLEGELTGRVRDDRRVTVPLLAGVLSGLACAAVALALARRYSFGRAATAGWAVAGFLLGPAGLLTMLGVREWPAREACPSCRRGRVVDRDRCPHCAAPPETPALDGTEIFAA